MHDQRLMIDHRHAVSAVIRNADGLVLAVLRPDEPGEELPGVWGLPATTLRDGEPPEDGVRRLGREKLGVELTPLRALAEGEQARHEYTLRMMVYEASIAGEPSIQRDASGTVYDAIDWLPDASFAEAATRGSLCCRLFLEALTPSPSPAGGREEHRRTGRERLRIPEDLRLRMVEVAREFRKNPTRSEALLWQALRGRQLGGLKFRRQHPIGPFVVDFYCGDQWLVVEVDGPIHEKAMARDRERQDLLEACSLRVLRINAEDAEQNLSRVLAQILRFADMPP